jgi:hypothetical protein
VDGVRVQDELEKANALLLVLGDPEGQGSSPRFQEMPSESLADATGAPIDLADDLFPSARRAVQVSPSTFFDQATQLLLQTEKLVRNGLGRRRREKPSMVHLVEIDEEESFPHPVDQLPAAQIRASERIAESDGWSSSGLAGGSGVRAETPWERTQIKAAGPKRSRLCLPLFAFPSIGWVDFKAAPPAFLHPAGKRSAYRRGGLARTPARIGRANQDPASPHLPVP